MHHRHLSYSLGLLAVLVFGSAATAQTLPTPPRAKDSSQTGAGTSGGPSGYTGTGRSGTVGSGPWDGTVEKTPQTPRPGDTPTPAPGPQGSTNMPDYR